MKSCVDHMLDMELMSPLGGRIVVPTQLLYRTQDPLAVELLFHNNIHGLTPWIFARDLLTEGTRTPSGSGDVRIWPTGSRPTSLLHLLLSSPHGSAHLTAPLQAVERWLCRTYRLVPPGSESDALDLDTDLGRFLDGGP
ncbi:SsgA family sporulation/cell division regulator [Streptomyces sp. SID2888]|uniref:SsgA family sporulation/cell division regulator n=1 Tax=Streptomyces sp. SID2888 TaxID=2690256 RepID=UPI00136839F4|nr:SsgA family sporulation/cell division regulator [Streptomyces sp. SID2888]MYV46598.1 SsgA family sporulation/cell division regulator [Streptomyces sp. SID2888]